MSDETAVPEAGLGTANGELKRLRAQRAAVLALHRPEAILVGETPQWCHTCMDGEDAVAYPCPTVRALGVTE